MKKTLFLFALLLAASCTKEPAAEPTTLPEAGEVVEPEYSMQTRTLGDGTPKHGDTFVLLSYRYGGTLLTDVQKNTVTAQQLGYYAYDDGTTNPSFAAGTLLPAQMREVWPYGPLYNSSRAAWVEGDPLLKNIVYAQRLESTPQTLQVPGADNTRYQYGFYYTAMIHPAVPMRNLSTYNLGWLAVFERSEIGKVYASDPMDPNADSDQSDAWLMQVLTNRQVHSVPDGTKLLPIRAAVKFYFYSEIDDDQNTATDPISPDFGITELGLVNSGSNGWYDARARVVYPNYNYTATYKTVYDPTVNLPVGNDTANVLDIYTAGRKGDGTAGIDDHRLDPAAPAIPEKATGDPSPGYTSRAKYSVEVDVFPSDYRDTNDGGTLSQVIPMTLKMKLETSPGKYSSPTLPISIRIDNLKRYNFYVNVKSMDVTISYTIDTWNPVTNTYEDFGSLPTEYKTVTFDPSTGGWDNGGGGSEQIGQ